MDKDFRPQQGQESNVNRNDTNSNTNLEKDVNNPDTEKQSSGARRKDEQRNSSGYGSSQRVKRDNVGPLESDLNELPSEKRRMRNNDTGPGLG